jgi:hypothetical protein
MENRFASIWNHVNEGILISDKAQEWEVLSELAHQFIHGSIGINGHALLFKARNSEKPC